MEIHKNIPRPSRRKYPFDDMEVNDSFFVETETPRLKQGSFLSLARRWAERHNPEARFSTRKEGDGFRIWRIK